MKPGRFGIILTGVVTVGALALIVLCPSVVGEVVYPVERAVSLFDRAVLSRVAGLFSGASAAAENVRLKREVKALSLLRGDCERLRVENARLRRVLDFRAKASETWIPAAVLSAGGGAAATRRVLRVDKGSLSGVCTNAVVVVPEGLVGRVTSVSAHTAEVSLITDPAVKVACQVQTTAGEFVSGILAGDGTGRLVLEHVQGSGRLQDRSAVETSGLGGIFPKGIGIGTLLVANGVRVKGGEVIPSVDFSTLEDVFIRRDQ